MRGVFALGAFAFAITIAPAAPAHSAVYVDDAGRSVSLERPARRVVTLAPNLTEFVYAVGGRDTLVGTVDSSNHPAGARRVTRIGDYQRLDVERILALKPDLVLVWYRGNQGREPAQLEAAGVKVFYIEPRRLDDIARDLERVGELVGHAIDGAAAAARWRRELSDLRAHYAAAPPVSVFFQVWPQPLMTLNNQHLTSDLISLCGGHNVFGELPVLTPHISIESVVAADPQAMFVADDDAAESRAWHRDPQNASLRMWHRFPSLTAVRQGWLYAVSGDLVTRQGPRALQGAKALCEALDQVRSERDGSRTRVPR